MNLLGLFAILPAVVLALDCHPEGPIVPKPRRLDRSSTFQQAVSGLTKVLDDAFGGKIKAGFDIQNTSVSIGIVSFDQAESDVPVWEYHHLSSANVNGTKSIGRHSQYLVGSISKAITVRVQILSERGPIATLTLTRTLSSCAAESILMTLSQSTSHLWRTKRL